jgi:hypothetical protein
MAKRDAHDLVHEFISAFLSNLCSMLLAPCYFMTLVALASTLGGITKRFLILDFRYFDIAQYRF